LKDKKKNGQTPLKGKGDREGPSVKAKRYGKKMNPRRHQVGNRGGGAICCWGPDIWDKCPSREQKKPKHFCLKKKGVSCTRALPNTDDVQKKTPKKTDPRQGVL